MTNIDTSLSTEFWRAQPHLFLAAGWGAEYCRCCLDPESTPIHTAATDPATHPGNCTDYRVARPPLEVGFAVTGWSDDGAACHFQMMRTWDEALQFATDHKAGKTNDDRPPYDHYSISERTYFTAVDTNVAVLS